MSIDTENTGCKNTENQAVFYGCFYRAPYIRQIAGSLILRDTWKEHNSHGVCDSAWEKNHRKSHAGHDPVDGERRIVGKAAHLQAAGNQNCFHTVQQSNTNPIGSQR